MAVSAGDIAFVALSADSASEGFSFVVLRRIAAGDSIRFIDGSKGTGDAITADAQLVWTNTGATAIVDARTPDGLRRRLISPSPLARHAARVSRRQAADTSACRPPC